jgi:hypothetical protein
MGHSILKTSLVHNKKYHPSPYVNLRLNKLFFNQVKTPSNHSS